jgi:hypothetical protein
VSLIVSGPEMDALEVLERRLDQRDAAMRMTTEF